MVPLVLRVIPVMRVIRVLRVILVTPVIRVVAAVVLARGVELFSKTRPAPFLRVLVVALAREEGLLRVKAVPVGLEVIQPLMWLRALLEELGLQELAVLQEIQMA